MQGRGSHCGISPRRIVGGSAGEICEGTVVGRPGHGARQGMKVW